MAELKTNNFRELIEYEEFESISWDDRLLGSKSKIQTTKELASVFNGSTSFSAHTIFLPNKFSKITLVVFITIILVILLGILFKKYSQEILALPDYFFLQAFLFS